MRQFSQLAIGLVLLITITTGNAIDSNPTPFDSPEQASRYQQLIKELRCVVCQNQSVAESNAELAQDVRELVRQKIIAGEDDLQITGFLVERYGDFVLYTPPFKPATYVLWLGPLALILLAFGLLLYFIKRHAQKTAAPPALTQAEHNRLTQVLEETKD